MAMVGRTLAKRQASTKEALLKATCGRIGNVWAYCNGDQDMRTGWRFERDILLPL